MATTTTTRQRLLTQLLAQARKTPDASEGLGVLEQFIFGLCREGATTDQAGVAFQNLKSRFFDWNEVRVSSYREIEEALEPLPWAEKKAHRIILFLQEVFEIHVSFDLDKFQKEGLKQALKKLARFKAADDHVCAWVAQRCLGGHALPLDETTVRAAQRLGLIESSTGDLEAIRTGLEHHVPKTKGMAFTEALSIIAGEHCDEEPRCGECPMARDCPSAGNVNEPAPTARRKPK